MFAYLILVLGFLISGRHTTQDAGSIQPFSLRLSHNLGPNYEYTPRGSVSIRYNRKLVGSYVQENPLSESESNNLKQLCANGRDYSIRAVLADRVPLRSSETFVKACSFMNSGLSERFVVNLDFNGEFLSLSTYTDHQLCTALDEPLTSDLFNTSVFVVQTASAPIPDTQTYLYRLETERKEKLKEGEPDNRSFLAKYWIYMVPIAILLMISSSGQQEEGS